MKNFFYGWKGEGEDFPPWMGLAKRNWFNMRTLFVLIPFNLLVALYYHIYTLLRKGFPLNCKDCISIKRELEETKYELSILRDKFWALKRDNEIRLATK